MNVGPLDPYRFRPTPTLTQAEAAKRAGVEVDVATRFWRALGLPELEDDAIGFDDADVGALTLVREIAEAGVSVEDLLAIARVYGQSMARIADAETRVFNRGFIGPLRAEGLSREKVEDRLEPLIEAFLERLSSELDYVHRRHLAVALQRLTTSDAGASGELLTVGFADLSDYSRLTRRLDEHEVATLIERFEEVVLMSCMDPQVRLVKIIGDGAMYVSSDPVAALDAARTLVRAAENDAGLPKARAGLDLGSVVPRGGDYFGAPVNRAARITSFARPGTILVSDELFGTLPGGSADVSLVGTRRLKGVGKVKLYKV